MAEMNSLPIHLPLLSLLLSLVATCHGYIVCTPPLMRVGWMSSSFCGGGGGGGGLGGRMGGGLVGGRRRSTAAETGDGSSFSLYAVQPLSSPPPAGTGIRKDRPLLRKFGKGINYRVSDSSKGRHRLGLTGHYTSDETIPCLDMKCNGIGSTGSISSRREILRAYTADSGSGGRHGRSSGSGCSIIRLTGRDAASIRGLVCFAGDFFDGVDDDACNRNADIKDTGVIRVANNVHAGFDANVNNEGKMQVLYTKIIPNEITGAGPSMLPYEVEDLVGTHSVNKAHDGMKTLLDIGSQITSAVLGSDSASMDKLLDDCTRGGRQESESPLANTVSNSYQRLIRYLEPKPKQEVDGSETGESDPAFWPHVDSTFVTLIPMTTRPGLEVWCPSSENGLNEKLAERGEWVRPIAPYPVEGAESSSAENESARNEDEVYVFALAGEFLQLLSNGSVPTCIHRVIPPQAKSLSSYGFSGTREKRKYVPRVSAPLFVRPRRGEDATLDIRSDLNICTDGESIEQKGLHFEEGLLEECDGMCTWEYMDCMSPNN